MDEFKNYRKYELKYFVFANIVLLYFLKQGNKNVAAIFEQADYLENINKILCFSIVSVVTYIIIFVFDSLIPGNIKWRMVYWVLPKPSESVFYTLSKNDKEDRFLLDELKTKCEKIYDKLDHCDDKEMKKRISKIEWYNLYLKYENEEKIKSAKRDYVITRDLYVSTAVILILSIASLCYSKELIPKAYFIALIIEFCVLKRATRVRGERLCGNVIALYVRRKKKKQCQD